jgi:hypothetical protein
MDEAWQLLRDGGLPLAAARRASRPSIQDLARAARAAIASEPRGRDAEALAAFLLAWHHHWPRSFATAHGTDALAVIEWAIRNVVDDNRYLKLRRIALENLADVI